MFSTTVKGSYRPAAQQICCDFASRTAECRTNGRQSKRASPRSNTDGCYEDLALAKKNNVVLVSTDFTVAELIADGMEPDAAKRTHEKYVARLKRAWDLGVEVVFGTDVMADVKGRSRGELAIEYVDSFREGGISQSNILRSMTTRAAALLDVNKVRGSIRAGMAADLVATPADPLHEIDG